MSRWERCWKETRKPQTFVSLVAAILAGFSLWVSYSIYENQITHYAWGRLSTHMPGNSGISGALNFLHERGEELRFIDLRPFGQAYADDSIDEKLVPSYEDKNLAHIVKANMNNANLAGAWLNDTYFIDSSFVNAVLTNARANMAVFKDTDFSDAILAGAEFSETQFVNVNFTDANLVKGHFNDAVLQWVIAIGMNAEEIDLSRAVGTGTRFDGTSMVDARLVGFAGQYGSYKDVDLSQAYLMEGNFSYSTLQKANLSGSYMFDANFDNTNLSWVDFSNAKGVKTATFEGAWAWEYALPKNLDAEVASKIVTYKQDCREEWEERVDQAYKIMEETNWIEVYSPPNDERCIVEGTR